MLSGRRGIGSLRAALPTEVIEVDRTDLLGLIQTDAQLSEILMRAFILRRVELIARGFGDVVLAGSEYCQGTLRVKEFLTRNGYPTRSRPRSGLGVQELLATSRSARGHPVLMLAEGPCSGTVHRRCHFLGLNEGRPGRVRALLVIGGAAASQPPYTRLPKDSSPMIGPKPPVARPGELPDREYLYSRRHLGQELSARSCRRREVRGGLMIAKGLDGSPARGGPKGRSRRRRSIRAVRCNCERRHYRAQGGESGRFEGAGIYYGATPIEAQLCRGEEVIVVGGGNSAGQAAVYLAQTVKRVHLLVRGAGLAESMSRYLIRRIEGSETIALRPHTEIVGLEGGNHLEHVSWVDSETEAVTKHDVRHVFSMTGAAPNTSWLDGCVVLDERGFIKTGPELSKDQLAGAKWPLARAPHLLETSRPGVLAVGDVRSGNVKRVASAVGEGSIAITFVHRILQE